MTIQIHVGKKACPESAHPEPCFNGRNSIPQRDALTIIHSSHGQPTVELSRYLQSKYSLLSLRFETNSPQKDSDRQRGPFEGGIPHPSEYGDNSIANGIATSSSQFMQPAPVESNPSPPLKEGKGREGSCENLTSDGSGVIANNSHGTWETLFSPR
jgi:hypothetical protein